jgi:hypothetical protein
MENSFRFFPLWKRGMKGDWTAFQKAKLLQSFFAFSKTFSAFSAVKYYFSFFRASCIRSIPFSMLAMEVA